MKTSARERGSRVVAAAACALVLAGSALAQSEGNDPSGARGTVNKDGAASSSPTAAPVPGETNLISINFPENVEIKVIAEFVTQRMGVNILYDESIANKRITIKAPAKIPASSLQGLLESALKIKGLALVDADQPGWKRIVPATDLVQVAKGPIQAGQGKPNDVQPMAVTQVFPIENADPKKVETALKPFLSQPGANTLVIPERGLLIVTEFSSNLPRVTEIIKLMDQPRGNLAFEFVPVQNTDAQQMATQVTQMLAAKQRAQGGAAGTTSAEGLDVTFDARTNRLAIVGTKSRVAEAIELVRALDISIHAETRVYTLRSASAERIDRLTKELLGPVEAKRAYRSAIDREANLLIVTAPPEVHKQIDKLRADLDQPITEHQSPVRFYKLSNTTATEVLQSIRALDSGGSLAGVNIEGLQASDGQPSLLTGTTGNAGINRIPSASTPNSGTGNSGSGPTSIPMTPSTPGTPGSPGTPGAPGAAPAASGVSGAGAGVILYRSESPTTMPSNTETSGSSGAQQGGNTVRGSKAVVTADPNTNSIIVIAEPEVQRVYEQLIKMLDRRRPQVLVEITIVTIDTTDNFSLGVEISKSGSSDKGRTLSFSNFGLSTVNADTGRLTLKPGLGFNGALISADIADIIIRALASHNRARLSSAPKILVNDNATGQLSSVNEAPFTSINTANSVSSTTTFAGYAVAGTTITVTPHISEGDHLQLEYSLALNNFTGEGSNGVPPPRQTNSVTSKVTIPDGDTIIVGGLTRKSAVEDIKGFPFIEKIPIVEYLFSNRSKTNQESTLFVFIRPVILRSDEFEDLRYYSSRAIQPAGVPADYPASKPVSLMPANATKGSAR